LTEFIRVFQETHLILGGARSGKTAYALALAEKSGLSKWMIATAGCEDREMSERIARHKAERGPDWDLAEERINLIGVLQTHARRDRIVVVDCLTLWLSNLAFEQFDLPAETERLSKAVPSLDGPVIFVSNEIGLGLVPETQLGRSFRDAQGRLNQALAQACDKVTFIAAGLPVYLKS
jgi:adenosylcobinamide kinase / adenosylcobinamide-phosphate guanylyltransferase